MHEANLPQRKSTRLANYDYTQSAAYFITICTHQRAYLFGNIIADEMRLNTHGHIADTELPRSAGMRREIELDAHIVMPNHIHVIVFLVDAHDEALQGLRAAGWPPLRAVRSGLAGRSLSAFVAGYKSAVTTAVNTLRDTPGEPVWQRNYYEHVIRNEEDLQRIRDYIAHNPANWNSDRLRIASIAPDP